jgi:NDP-sugar pyrophosphorylase family protein
MKAMILAAGLGSRLRPLTDDRPKALVTVAGRTLLEIALARLRLFGVRDVIVNAHHFADMVIEYLKANQNFGMHVEVSREDVLLDTGGGLKNASHFFLDSNGNSHESFMVHNVDVISTIDLARMARFHREQNALATLAVQDRDTSRYLLFDKDGLLCGRQAGHEGRPELVRSAEHLRPLAFSGIHVLSPRIFAGMEEDGAFSIITSYLRLAAKGERIVAFRANEYEWRDLGRPEGVVQAKRDIADGKLSIT